MSRFGFRSHTDLLTAQRSFAVVMGSKTQRDTRRKRIPYGDHPTILIPPSTLQTRLSKHTSLFRLQTMPNRTTRTIRRRMPHPSGLSIRKARLAGIHRRRLKWLTTPLSKNDNPSRSKARWSTSKPLTPKANIAPHSEHSPLRSNCTRLSCLSLPLNFQTLSQLHLPRALKDPQTSSLAGWAIYLELGRRRRTR